LLSVTRIQIPCEGELGEQPQDKRRGVDGWCFVVEEITKTVDRVCKTREIMDIVVREAGVLLPSDLTKGERQM